MTLLPKTLGGRQQVFYFFIFLIFVGPDTCIFAVVTSQGPIHILTVGATIGVAVRATAWRLVKLSAPTD